MPHRRAKKLWALFLCLAFVAVIFCSAAFISEHGHHECDNSDCAICLQLSRAERLLQQLCGGVYVAGVALLAALWAFIGLLHRRAAAFVRQSPVALSVRINS